MMKKLTTLATILIVSFAAKAQGNFEPFRNRDFNFEFLRATTAIIAVVAFAAFILSIIRMIFDYRIKNKMIEKGVSDKVVEQFLQPTKRDTKAQAIKWFLILFGIGLGLIIVNLTMPLGLHSVAIMAFSTSLSFLGHYYFIRKSAS